MTGGTGFSLNEPEMMKTKQVLVTGASQGIGLEICRQLGKSGWQVWLTARNSEEGRSAVRQLNEQNIRADFIFLDITDTVSIRKAFQALQHQSAILDVLINNAAILLPDDRQILTASDDILKSTIQTNVYGALRVVQNFLPLFVRGSRIINMSSGGGSMDDEVEGWAPVYCLSKTMLNALTRQLDFALRSEGIVVNSMCPGWVKTRMGGAGADRPVEKGAETAVWLATTPEIPSGKFFRDKKIIPW